MGKEDQGFRDLLARLALLVGKAVNEEIESEEFHKSLREVNQEMSGQYGCAVDAIGVALGFEFVTVPISGGEREEGKEKLSLNFKFGSSLEDQEMKKRFGLDEQEMNRLLEQARREGSDERGDNNAVLADVEEMPRPPAEMKETAEPADPRSISQIINDIRTVARGLNFNSQKAFNRHIKENDFFRRKGIIFPEGSALENDTLWLNGIQELINFIQRELETPQLRKETLLVLERAIQSAGTGKL